LEEASLLSPAGETGHPQSGLEWNDLPERRSLMHAARQRRACLTASMIVHVLLSCKPRATPALIAGNIISIGATIARPLADLPCVVLENQAANNRSNSAGTYDFPSLSVITTCQPALAKTRALATMINELWRSTLIFSLSRSAIIL
jgi:hypothetical protein